MVNGHITKQKYHSLKISDDLSKVCDLFKTHKKDYPFRLIISSKNTTLYSFVSSNLYQILYNSLSHSRSYVKNNFDIKKFLMIL